MNRLCRLFVLAAAAGLLMGAPIRVKAETPAAPLPTSPLTMDSLLRTDRAALESLYSGAVPGTVPLGPLAGRAIPSPGTRKNLRQSRLIGMLWKGKEFPGDGTMVNRLTFGVKAVHTEVYHGESWLDGRPSIILDYANTSRLFSKARDEMREISPGLYLGITYLRASPEPKLLMFYTVQTQ